MKKSILFILCLSLFLGTLTACGIPHPYLPSTPTPLITDVPIVTQTPTPAPTFTPTPTATPVPTPTPDPWAAYFRDEEEVEIIEDETWRYRSPNLAIFIHKIYMADCKSVFFISHIYTKSRDFTPYVSALMSEDGRKAVMPEVLARKYRAVYAQNGNYFVDSENDKRGPDMRNGKIFKKNLGKDCLVFMPDGTLAVLNAKEDQTSLDHLAASGVKDIYGFGPILVEDGQMRTDLKESTIYGANPRSAFGMVEPGHYVGILVDGRKPNVSVGVNLTRLAQEFIDQGCICAYNLDGGQSSAMVFMGKQINDHKNESAFAGQRRIPDMLVFGQSNTVPEE